jgi:hypothetical protein
MLRSQIFVEAFYHSYNVVKTEVERQGRKRIYIYVYIYTDFDTASIYLTITRQGYSWLFHIYSQSKTAKKNTNCCIITYLTMTTLHERRIDKFVSYINE